MLINNSQSFVPKEKWEALPLTTRIHYRSKFSHFIQLPNSKTLEHIYCTRKKEFLNETIKFRIKRSKELLEEYDSEEPLSTI